VPNATRGCRSTKRDCSAVSARCSSRPNRPAPILEHDPEFGSRVLEMRVARLGWLIDDGSHEAARLGHSPVTQLVRLFPPVFRPSLSVRDRDVEPRQ
jgi:hypothetical protein